MRADAGVRVQVLRHTRAVSSGEVAGGAHDGEPVPWSDWNRNHVLCQAAAGSDAGVESCGDDVHQPVIGDDLQPDPRIGFQEPAHHGLDDQLGRDAGDVQAQQPRRPAPEGANLLDRLGDIAQGRADPLQQVLARLGDADAPVRPVEQPHVEDAFKAADDVAQRRRADAALQGGLAEASMPGDGQEGFQRG